MDRMLVVVFDTESKATEGERALVQLSREGIIVLYHYAVVAKKSDGTVATKLNDDTRGLGAVAGTSFGALVGSLGGPIGLPIGATLGLIAGGAADLNNSRIDVDCLNDVTRELTPGKFALVAEIQESWTTALDIRMENIGGTVLRRTMSEVKKEVDAEGLAAMKADLAQLKAEHAKAQANRKGKLQEKISQLDSRILVRLEKAKERRIAGEREAQANGELLETKAAALKTKAEQVHL